MTDPACHRCGTTIEASRLQAHRQVCYRLSLREYWTAELIGEALRIAVRVPRRWIDAKRLPVVGVQMRKVRRCDLVKFLVAQSLLPAGTADLVDPAKDA